MLAIMNKNCSIIPLSPAVSDRLKEFLWKEIWFLSDSHFSKITVERQEIELIDLFLLLVAIVFVNRGTQCIVKFGEGDCLKTY